MKILYEENNLDNNLLEKVSELCHNQWSNWTEYFIEKHEIDSLGKIVLDKNLFDRWKRQIRTSYDNLSEEEKDSDRREAKKFIELFKQFKDSL